MRGIIGTFNEVLQTCPFTQSTPESKYDAILKELARRRGIDESAVEEEMYAALESCRHGCLSEELDTVKKFVLWASKNITTEGQPRKKEQATGNGPIKSGARKKAKV